MRRLITFAGLFALVGLATAQSPVAPWNFVEHTVATGLKGGYHVTAADFNKDGRVDLLAVATGPKVDLVWFENPLSAEAQSAKVENWTPHVMASDRKSTRLNSSH